MAGRLTAISSGSGVRLEVAVLDGGRWRPIALDTTALEAEPALRRGELSVVGCLAGGRIVMNGTVVEPGDFHVVPVLVTVDPSGSARAHLPTLTGLPRQGGDEPPLEFSVDGTGSRLTVHQSRQAR